MTAGAGDLSPSLSLSRLPKPSVAASDLGGDRLLFFPLALARSVRLAVFTSTWGEVNQEANDTSDALYALPSETAKMSQKVGGFHRYLLGEVGQETTTPRHAVFQASETGNKRQKNARILGENCFVDARLS